jgi:hypothetical protein
MEREPSVIEGHGCVRNHRPVRGKVESVSTFAVIEPRFAAINQAYGACFREDVALNET